ncbi:MAG: aspartyl protease family protein [Caulobacterales bacterium]
MALAALGLALLAGPALADCTLGKIAELPVAMSPGGQPLVSAKINGVDGKFIADTGGFFSMLTPASATKFGLHAGPMPGGDRVGGITGEASVKLARANDFTVLGVTFHAVDFLVGEHALGPEADGLLGQNLLSAVDAEYDLANGVIRLFKPMGCGSKALAYWAQDGAFSTLAISPIEPPGNEISGSATLNGQRIRVTLDTGSSRSILTLRAARAAGVKTTGPDVISADVTGGIGPRRIDTWLAPFGSFEIGGEQIKSTHLRLGDIELSDADMILGADFFLSHRVYVAKSQSKVYFTYNGGPVFNLDRPATAAATQPPAGAAPPPTATIAPAPDADEPKDAAGFSRRGAAFVARRQFDRAIDDFTKAAALEPNEPKHLDDRGMARWADRQPVLAMADFDAALKLKPDDESALMARGELRLANKDQTGAREDFDHVLRLAPSVRLRVAGAYVRADLFEDAVGQFDQWIAEHPKDEDMAEALNRRCWARALWNRDLDKALADCDAALRLSPGLSSFLDSRGLVHLRRGELDLAIADYDAVLREQPKSAWSLYGRGLARLRKGDKTDGQADIQAATALAPRLPDQAKGLGLTP